VLKASDIVAEWVPRGLDVKKSEITA